MSKNPSTPPEKWQKWFENVWAEREDRIYPKLFGEFGKRIATIPRELFKAIGIPEVEEWWLTHGVITVPPQGGRSDWLYVTSGMSNPWGVDPAESDRRLPSGLGLEMMMRTPEEAPWVIQILHWLMAVQILAAAGYLKGETVRYGDLVPLGRPVTPEEESVLKNVFLVPPPMEPTRFELPSGTVDLMLCVGISNAEHDYALKEGADALLKALKEGGAYPITAPRRASVV